ncbi:MAG: peptidase M14 carboxypeptidase A [Parcubacteria group bacterium Gr01-1014_46]|nr:MAG: peptidase M14 carboxypeptidase A [Parcubacteria group bacterium Gr01-1014_46]
MKNITITILVLVILGFGFYYFTKDKSPAVDNTPTATNTENNGQATTTGVKVPEGSELVIGKSVEGRDITAYNYGQGETQVLLIGGIHGGYSWNTSLVAFELMDYLKANPNAVPKNVKVTVIPVLNPDGLNKVVGTSSRFKISDVAPSKTTQIAGRYNGNKVDLSRNFDCNWQATGKWQTTTVSGGTKVFSEPESMAVKTYLETHSPSAVVVWYSAAGGVYASSCNTDVLPQTTTITNLYAKASGYSAHQSFDFYETSGDLVNWLAKNNIPAISVLLTTHTETEWDKNKKGVEALLQSFAK